MKLSLPKDLKKLKLGNKVIYNEGDEVVMFVVGDIEFNRLVSTTTNIVAYFNNKFPLELEVL